MFDVSIIDLIIMALGGVVLLIWLVFYLIGMKHNAMFDVLDSKEYPLKEMYGMGYAVLTTFKFSFKSNRDRKLRQALDVLYGTKYAEYYLRVVHAQQITMASFMLLLAFILYGFTGEIIVLGAFWVLAGAIYYYYGDLPNKRVQTRSEEILRDFTEVVSKLALLINAGMILRDAWCQIAAGGTTTIYKEMQVAVDEMGNGKSEIDAIHNFAMRCMIPEVKKFSSTIIQGIAKGNKELSYMLQEQSKEVLQLRGQYVKRAGEKAASKMMIPITIIFVGILFMILVPLMANMGM